LALVFLYLRTFLYRGIPFVTSDDQDLFFARAVRILHGHVPYRDFFEIVTPGTEWLYAAAFHLFGVHAWIVDAWAVLVGSAFCALITRIAQHLFSGSAVLLPAMLFLVMDFSSALSLTHQWYSTLAALAAVCVLMAGNSLARIITASTLCAAATLFTQTKGVFVFIAIAAYLLYRRHSERSATGAQSKNPEALYPATTSNPFSTPAAFVLPYLAIVLGALAHLTARSGLHAIWFDLVTFPTKYMSTAELNTPVTYFHQLPELLHIRHAADIVPAAPVLFIYLLVPFIYLAGGWALWNQRIRIPGVLWQQLLLIHLVGIALFLAIAPGPRYFRLCTVAPPAILICVWLLRETRIRSRLTLLSWILAGVYALLLPLHRQTGWHGVLDLPIGRTAFYDRQLYDEFQWFAQHSQPGQTLFNDAALGFYLSLDNPAPTEFVNYDETTRPQQAARLLEAIRLHPPRFIVLSPASEAIPTVDQTAPLRAYIYAHYTLAKVFPLNHSAYTKEIWELREQIAMDADTAVYPLLSAVCFTAPGSDSSH
jgi:hypothetical protein